MPTLAFLHPISSFAVSDELRNQIYSEFAKKINCENEDLNELLNFKSSKNESSICYLVPLYRDDEHKNCMIDLLADPESNDKSKNSDESKNSNESKNNDESKNSDKSKDSKSKKDYMKYYLDYGTKGLPNKENVEQKFYVNALKRVWPDDGLPRSLNFVIDIDGQSVGRVGVGPMFPKEDGCYCEVGYAILQDYSGKGYTSDAVDCAIKFLEFLVEKKIYNISKLRATAKDANEASNHILEKLKFSKQVEPCDDGYGPENEYFYKLHENG